MGVGRSRGEEHMAGGNVNGAALSEPAWQVLKSLNTGLASGLALPVQGISQER